MIDPEEQGLADAAVKAAEEEERKKAAAAAAATTAATTGAPVAPGSPDNPTAGAPTPDNTIQIKKQGRGFRIPYISSKLGYDNSKIENIGYGEVVNPLDIKDNTPADSTDPLNKLPDNQRTIYANITTGGKYDLAGITDRIVEAGASPAGPLMSNLRKNMSQEDFNRLQKAVTDKIKGQLANPDRNSFSDNVKRNLDKWETFFKAGEKDLGVILSEYPGSHFENYVPKNDADAELLDLVSLLHRAQLKNGSTITIKQFLKDNNINRDVEDYLSNIAAVIIDSGTQPNGELLQRLRKNLSKSDLDFIHKELRNEVANNNPDDYTDPAERENFKNWKTYAEDNKDFEIGITLQDWIAAAIAKESGGKVSDEQSRNIISRAWNRLDNTKFMGKAITDFLIGAGVSFGVKTVARLALGGGFGIAAGAGIGSLAGIGKEAITTYRKQQRELTEEAKSEIDNFGPFVDMSPEQSVVEARRQLKERLKVTHRKEMAKAVVKGAVFGAIGGAIGAELHELGIFNSIKDFAGEHNPIQWAKDHNPFGGGSHEAAGGTATPPAGGTPPPENPPTPPGADTHKPYDNLDEPSNRGGGVNPSETGGRPGGLNITQEELERQTHAAADEAAKKAAAETRAAMQPDIDRLHAQVDNLQHQIDALKEASKPSGVPGTGAASEAAQAVGAPAGLENLPKTVYGLEQVGISLHQDSNPWNETHAMLREAFDQKDPSNAQIQEITKMICKDSGIKVPAWGLDGNIDQHNLPPGFKLKVSHDTLLRIAAMKKGG